jgi:hypothetical protein
MFIGTLPAASNRADWSEIFEVYDDETGEQIDLSTAIITLQIRDGYRCIDASIVLVDVGKFEASVSLGQMKQLCAGTHDIGGTMTRDGIVTQEIIGNLPVLDGVVR